LGQIHTIAIGSPVANRLKHRRHESGLHFDLSIEIQFSANAAHTNLSFV
jgi:hypothetical protein